MTQSAESEELTVERALDVDSLHNSCRAVWVCKRCGNCARHCKHNDPANFHEDLDFPCSGPCQCIDCAPCVAGAGTEVFAIKPLEWEWFERSEISRGYRSIGISGALVFQDNRGSGGWSVWHWMPKEGGTHVCASPEEGKQLAEEHWQKYIKQALVQEQQQ